MCYQWNIPTLLIVIVRTILFYAVELRVYQTKFKKRVYYSVIANGERNASWDLYIKQAKIIKQLTFVFSFIRLYVMDAQNKFNKHAGIVGAELF